jgi:hypothetical protein
MTGDKDEPGGFSLRRWSRRKLAASREAREDAAPPPAPAPPPDTTALPASVPAADAKAATLPSIDSLTTDSDFTPFMRADVEPGLQHQALRKLFSDPRFNVMDGLDTYIDDYSKPDPIAPDVVARLAHARYLFDPPATRVDENGFVVDVPVPPPGPVETASSEAAPPEALSGDAAKAPDTANVAESASPDAVAPASGDAADNVESVPVVNPSVQPARR